LTVRRRLRRSPKAHKAEGSLKTQTLNPNNFACRKQVICPDILSLISEMQKAPKISYCVWLVVHTQHTQLKLPIPTTFFLFIKSMGLMEKATPIEEQDKILLLLEIILFVSGTFREPRK
jgi:hypothetical protein